MRRAHVDVRRLRAARCATLGGVGSHTISQLLHDYGCLIVFAAAALQALGPPVPGTTVLVAAALYAATTHGLPIAGVIAAGAAGALAGTTGGFALGRWGGERLLRRAERRLGPARIRMVRRQVVEHGVPWLFMGRFITGVRNVLGLLAGAGGMSLARFLPVSAAAAAAWALISGLEYYWFGRALTAASTWVQVVLVVAGLGWMGLSLTLLRRRARARLMAAEPDSA